MTSKNTAACIRPVLIAALGLMLIGCASIQKKGPAKDENTAAYQYDLASIALRYGLEDEAIKYLDYALALDPGHQPSLFLLASLHMKKKNYAQAEAAFIKSLELKPDDAEAHTRLGIVYRETGAQDKAEEEFLKAYTLDGGPNAALNLAQHFFDRGKLEPALEYAGLALKKNDRSVPALNLQGVILNQLGRNAEAAASFEKILAIGPDNIVSAFNLAASYIRLDRLREARDILEKLLPRVTDQKLREKITATLETMGK